jgi:hypothetical protein
MNMINGLESIGTRSVEGVVARDDARPGRDNRPEVAGETLQPAKFA